MNIFAEGYPWVRSGREVGMRGWGYLGVYILIIFGSSWNEWVRGGVVFSLSHSREVEGAPELIRAR